MSVNAVGTEPQVQKKSSSGAAIGTGLGMGALGAGAAYMWGGKTPSLEEVFAQAPDKFTSSYEAMKQKGETEANTVKTEYEALQTDLKPKADEVAAKQAAVNEAIENVAEFDNKDTLNQAVTEAETKLGVEKKVKIGDAEVSVKYTDAKAELKNAEEALANAAKGVDKAPLEQAVTDAKTKVGAFDAEVKALDEAKAKRFEAKKVKFDADEATKALREELTSATEALNTAKTEAIGKLKDKTELTGAFGKVKKALLEGRGKAMAIWGGAALVAGLILGKLFGGKKAQPEEVPAPAEQPAQQA